VSSLPRSLDAKHNGGRVCDEHEKSGVPASHTQNTLSPYHTHPTSRLNISASLSDLELRLATTSSQMSTPPEKKRKSSSGNVLLSTEIVDYLKSWMMSEEHQNYPYPTGKSLIFMIRPKCVIVIVIALSSAMWAAGLCRYMYLTNPFVLPTWCTKRKRRRR
jgi:hypothetical protein